MKIAAVRIYYIKYTEISPIRLYKRNENEKKCKSSISSLLSLIEIHHKLFKKNNTVRFKEHKYV